jgi:O-antigen/teichoic acid export membrane protein
MSSNVATPLRNGSMISQVKSRLFPFSILPMTAVVATVRRDVWPLFFQEPTSARFIRGTFWSIAGMISAQGLGLIASVLTARLLGRVGYGELGMVSTTALTFGLFAGLGLGITATKYVAELRVSNRERAGRVIGLCLLLAAGSGALMSLFVFLSAETLSVRLLSSRALASDLRFCSLLLLINTVAGTQNGVLAGLESFKLTAQVNLIRGLLSFPLMIGGAWFFGRHGAVAALVISGATGLLIAQIGLLRECARDNISIRYRDSRTELSLIWGFSLPALLNELIIGPAMWLGSAILVHVPAGYGEFGLVNVGQQWRRILLFLPSVFASVTLPILSSEQHERSPRFRSMLEMAQGLSIVAVVPVATLIMCLSGPIVRLYGREFADAAPVILGILVGASITAIASAGGPGIRARGKIWIETFQNLAWAVVYVGFAALFCPHWGAGALSVGFAVACLIHSIWSYLYLYCAGDVTPAMLRGIAAAAAFVVASGCIALWCDPDSRVWILAPVVLTAIVLSMTVWLPEEIRANVAKGIRSANCRSE